MKKLIQILGIVALAIVVILNIVYTADMNSGEQISIKFSSFIYIIGLIITAILIYFITEVINKHLYNGINEEKKRKLRKWMVAIAIVLYLILNVVWLIFVRPGIVADSIHVLNLAQTFYENNPDRYLPNLTYAGIPLIQYMQAYPHQITLAFVYNMLFCVLHCDLTILPRIFNVFFNLLIILALYKITKQLSKDHKMNNTRMFILILTFFTIPMLATFMYGDIPALALSLFSVYFMMKFTDTKQVRYGVFASILTMIAYLMRMNTLIFVIATVIYLVLNIFKDFKEKEVKEKLINVAIIAMFLVLTFVPSSLVKTYYFSKYNLEKGKTYPSISYILMAMEDANSVNYITKSLYPDIAKKYKTTIGSVERAIRHAVDIVWIRGNKQLLGEIFGTFVIEQQERPTNSEFIAAVADWMRLEYQIRVS